MTLVEVLVVLAIVAVLASASVLSFGVGAGIGAQAEAKRLQVRMQLAADESMLDDRTLALSIGPSDYSFVEWDHRAGAWRPSASQPFAEDHALPSGITLASGDGRRIVPLGLAGSVEDIALRIAGRDAWIVSFDGLTARARVVGAR